MRGKLLIVHMSNLKKLKKKYLIEDDNRKLLINVAGNYAVKGGAMIVSLIIMPAYMKYFESQAALGMWFTVVQLLNWIMLLDFGIGGGLRNKIVEPLEKGDKSRVTELVSSAYFSVAVIVIVLSTVLCFTIKYFDWYLLFGISPEDISDVTLIKMLQITIVGVCIRFFTVLLTHLLYAMQRAVMPGLLNLLSNLLIMFYLIVAEPLGTETDIINLAYVNAIANNLPALITTIWLFTVVLKGLWPRISSISVRAMKEVLGTGGILFYLQIVIMLLFNVKEIYITWFFKVEDVVVYQVYYKLIGIIGGLYSLALNPIWSAVSKALVENKKQWIKDLYKKGLFLIGLFSLLQVILVIFMPWIETLWLGNEAIGVSRNTGLLFCVYNIVYMWMMLNYNFACGMGHTKSISKWLTLASVFNLLLTIWGSSLYTNWSVVIVVTTIVTIPCAVFTQKDIFKVIKELGVFEVT